jgi:hypothetical protein
LTTTASTPIRMGLVIPFDSFSLDLGININA